MHLFVYLSKELVHSFAPGSGTFSPEQLPDKVLHWHVVLAM